MKQEGIRGAQGPYSLIRFNDLSSVETCKVISDGDMGGFSKAALEFQDQNEDSPPHARFRGSISIELPVNRPQIQRTGYAAWRTLDRPATLFGRSLWDIDPYNYMALRVKSDGRKYFVNLQTDSIVPTDLHQHRLLTRQPGQWETVFIKWHDFVRTNHGQVVEPQNEMLRQKVRTAGIGLIDRVPGPYDLAVEEIWATNSTKYQTAAEHIEAVAKHEDQED
jgi:NADH dehydrogenase [ubiquinone] 1 alpha subcomplex assembly factor 1